MRRFHSQNSGFTIMEVVISAAIFAVVALGMNEMMTRQLSAVDHIDKKLETMELRHLILSLVDCNVTLNHICDQNKKIIKSRKRDLTIDGVRYEHQTRTNTNTEDEVMSVSQNVTAEKAEWVLRPYCKNDTVFVDYSRKIGSRFAVDHMTGETYNWKPLFKSGLCSKKLKEPVSCPPGLKVYRIDFDTGKIWCAR